MVAKVRKVVGYLLLLAGLAVLVFAPSEFSPVHLFVGLALMMASVPFLLGTVGAPPAVVRARQAADQAPRVLAPVDVPERTFRSTTGRWRMALLYALVAGLVIATGAVIIAWPRAARPLDLVLLAAPMLGTALFLTWYIRRYWNLWVTVGPLGISSQQYLRRVTMAWREVVALTTQTHFPGLRAYAVWSGSERISFYQDGIEDCAELVEILAQVTGLGWVEGG
jgi:hypothetical protein